jgi:hypothetical protein
LKGEIADLRTEVRAGFADLRNLITKAMVWGAVLLMGVTGGILTALAHAMKWF